MAKGSPPPEWSVHFDESADTALGGAVNLIQPRKGFRFSIDAVLLARFAAERPAENVVDLGCGCGVVGLCLLTLGGAQELIGIDLLPEMVDRAVRSSRANGFGAAARFVAGDLCRVRDLLPRQSQQLVVANPPYRPVGLGKPTADPGAAVARTEIACTVADVAAAADHLLGTRGEFCVVYPAARLATLLAVCRAHRLEPKEIRLIHPSPLRAARLVLLRSVKGAGEGLTVRAPLFLHDALTKYSVEAETLLGPP